METSYVQTKMDSSTQRTTGTVGTRNFETDQSTTNLGVETIKKTVTIISPDEKASDAEGTRRRSFTLDEKAFLQTTKGEYKEKEAREQETSKNYKRSNSYYKKKEEHIAVSEQKKKTFFNITIGSKPKTISRETGQILQEKKWDFATPQSNLLQWKEVFKSKLIECAKNNSKGDPVKILESFLKTALSHTAIPARLKEASEQVAELKEAHTFFHQFAKILDPLQFQHKCSQLGEHAALLRGILDEEEVLQLLCSQTARLEWLDLVKQTCHSEEIKKFSSSIPVTDERIWEEVLKTKFVDLICQNPKEDADHIVSLGIQKCFEMTTIRERFQEAYDKYGKQYPFLKIFLHVRSPKEVSEKLISLEHGSLESEIAHAVLGCGNIIKRCLDMEQLNQWTAYVKECKQLDEERLQILQRNRKGDEPKRLQDLYLPATNEQAWKRDLFAKLTILTLEKPNEKADRLIQQAIELSFASTNILHRIREASRKNGITYHFLIPFRVEKFDDFAEKILSTKDKLTSEEREILSQVVGCYSFLLELCDTHSTLFLDLKKSVMHLQIKIVEFPKSLKKEQEIESTMQLICLAVDKKRFFFTDKIVFTTLKLQDMLETFRAFWTAEGHILMNKVIRLNNKSLEIQKLEGSSLHELQQSTLEHLFNAFLREAKMQVENIRDFATLFIEMGKSTTLQDLPAIDAKIPLLHVFKCMSVNNFTTANTALRETFFPFCTDKNSRIHIRPFGGDTSTLFDLKINPEESMYSVTQTKTYSFFSGTSDNHIVYAEIDVHWTVLGSLDPQKISREGRLHLSNFRIHTTDEKILAELYHLLVLCRTQLPTEL